MSGRIIYSQLLDPSQPVAVEDGFRAFFNYAAQHDFSFDSLYTATGFTGTAGLTINAGATSVELTAPASPASTWFTCSNATVVPRSMVMRFTVNDSGGYWAAVVGKQASGDHYLVGVNGSRYPTILKYNVGGGTHTVLSTIPIAIPTVSNITVAFRETRQGDNSQGVWNTISMWANERHFITHIEPATSLATAGYTCGFAAYTNNAVTFSNPVIPELGTVADWMSLDPGEAPMGGLQRGTEGYYLKFFVRHNGAVRAWKPKTTTSKATYTDAEIESRTVSVDLRNLYTHIRQVGAYTQAEYLRQDLITKYGHRFTEVNNPYLMSEAECYDQAILEIKRREETADQESFSAIYRPWLEHEDHITTPTGERIISSRQVSVNGAAATESVTARKYIYGS